MFGIVLSIVLFSILFLGLVWLLLELVDNYKLCKDKRSQAHTEDFYNDQIHN